MAGADDVAKELARVQKRIQRLEQCEEKSFLTEAGTALLAESLAERRQLAAQLQQGKCCRGSLL
jgi:hypothetical protein